ncbi:MAG TPA: hypothetical protein VJM11_01330, partial [Nevskiaceae bacterium]|nr:hypothetical protein [Nevskiaceae bacterium]
TVQSLHFDDVSEAGLILLFGLQRRHLRRRLFKKPEGSEEWIFLFDILTSAPAPGANAAFVEQKLARNRRLYEEARALGGKVYVISALHMQASDWVQEYGANHREVAQLKQRFDPAGILTPTPGVFA